MQFPTKYNCLNQNEFVIEDYKLVPIRYEDKLTIMKWRNEQMYHLRQDKPLTEKSQEDYFNGSVARLFDHEKPNQILFSYLKNDRCIGYGGLVHINWIDKNAEISFVLNTNLESNEFSFHWSNYLGLIEQVAFKELFLHKIFTYAFDVRPNLYPALESAGFSKEAVLEEHCFFEGKFRDVIIHSKKNKIELCLATIDDAQLLFDWVNNSDVRRNSLITERVVWDEHLKWFKSKLQSQSKIYILFNDKIPVGQIRLDFMNTFWNIDYSIDSKHRGNGFGKIIIELAIKKFNKGDILKAIVKKENISSLKIFQKLKFDEFSEKNSNIISFIKKIN